MKVTPIASPLPGEHLAATFPRMRPEALDARWRLRLHFWAGRALTAEALELDQENRAARLAWRGRVATPGIVTGLEVALEAPATPQDPLEPAGHVIHLLPGHGFLPDGEDVVVPRPLSVALDRIPVRYVRRVGTTPEDPTEPLPDDAIAGRAIDAGGFSYIVDTFADGHRPWAAVLVLCPAEFRTFERVRSDSPCELDPSFDAFADERRRDAAVLRLCQLPVSLESLPELADRDDPRWRNRLTHAVLTADARRSSRQQIRFFDTQPEGDRWDTRLREAGLLPWELLGLPIALISSERVEAEAGERYFLDRAVVVRAGGLARPRTRPAVALATGASEALFNHPGAGSPFTWRAAVDQFAEHLGALATGTEAEVAAAAARFQFVPPAGFLPRAALRLLTTPDALRLPRGPGGTIDRAGVNHFFPGAFTVEAVPVAIEDLDAALAAAAPLQPYDLAAAAGDTVRLLVPLPQRLFDPHLLVVEQEDPVFAATVARFAATRQDWRQRRDLVRTRRDALQALAAGPQPAAAAGAAFDPGQVEPEPVETAAGLGIVEALVSPLATDPAEARITFAAAREIPATATVFLRLRIDEDAAPDRIEARWRTAAGEEGIFRWTEPPSLADEPRDAAGRPLPTPLWRQFTVRLTQLNLGDSNIAGFTLRIESGRIGLAAAGQLVPGQQPGEMVEDPFWRAQDAAPAPEFAGGEWTRVTGDQLLAPFEEQYIPTFADGRTLAARVADVEAAVNPTTATPRTPALSVTSAGLERVLGELDREANEADDFVDANFTRAQVNLYRIRKLVVGETAAQKLLINPAIAAIAEQETATASAEQLGTFITRAKSRSVDSVAVNEALRGPAAGPAPTATLPFARNTGIAFEAVNPILDTVRREGILTARPDAFRREALRDVVGERPESGPTLPPRGLSIGQRFVEPPATRNLSYARAALTDLVNQLPRLRLPLVGETVRSLTGEDVSLLALQGRVLPPPPPTGTTPQTPETIRNAAVTRLFAVTDLSDDTDEAEVTLAALDFTEIKSAILRTIEKVVQRRRVLVQAGRETLAGVEAQRAAAAARVLVIEGRLAEARHDVGVARALRQEEQARVAEINERRDALIAGEVRFLAYVRPRTVDSVRRNLAYWMLEPFGVPAPVPACLQRHDEPPPPLHAFVQLIRHAPARWFTALAPQLARLDTAEKLIALLDAARGSAASFAALDAAAALRGASSAVQFTVLGAQQVIGGLRQRSSALQIAAARGLRWKEFQRDAEQHAAVGDLIGGRHGSAEVSAAAAEELEVITRVATCLHAEFAAVTPAIRLSWIERFSQFDRPAPLRDLTVLPQFGRLDRATRRRLQEFADWLFGRVRATEADAVALINDLVRLSLLLASHAPVNRIIAGHVPRPTLVRPGIQIPIRPLNPELVRVGMEFHVWSASRVVARGRVEDLQEGEVSARVETVEAQTTTIDASMKVQFVPAALSVFRR